MAVRPRLWHQMMYRLLFFSMRTIFGCRLSVLAKYLLIQDARPLVVVQSGNSSMCTCRIVPRTVIGRR